MKFLWLGVVAFVAMPLTSLAQKREIVELQRDVAGLQDTVRNLDRSFNERMGGLTTLLNQTIDSIGKVNTSVAMLERSMQEQQKILSGPIATMGSKVDQMSSDFQAVRVSIDDLNGRLNKLQQSLVDLNNTIKVIQTPVAPPPAAPGAAPSGPGSASGAPPVPAETLYANAMRDKDSGNYDVALQEFNDYLRYYGNTGAAPNAQYYIGEIYYNRKDYNNALKAFDMVLEVYPDNNKTLDATYMKGLTLLRMGERTKAAEEFREVYRRSPRSELGTKAREQLRSLGLPVSSAAPKKSTTRKVR